MKTRALLLLLALPLSADTLSDVKAAVGRLSATTPVNATYTVQSNVKSSGKFGNVDAPVSVSAEVSQDPTGLTVRLAQPLLKKASAEMLTPGGDTASRSNISAVDNLQIADALDFRDPLLGMLAMGKVTEEKRVLWSGKQARMLVLKIEEPQRKSAREIRLGKVSTEEDRLSVWIGDDLIPLAAERVRRQKGGFLMFKAETATKTSYVFTRAGDRLVMAKREETGGGTVMGQKIDEHTVTTVAIR